MFLFSWLLVTITTFIILVSYYLPRAYPHIHGNAAKMDSLRTVRACGWYCMMLLEIYYSGALTMFFSTEITAPFETMRQVMRAYPDWKLQLQPGMQVHFIYQAEDGDPDYAKFWDRVNRLPEETFYALQEQTDGLQRMRDDFLVVLCEEASLRGFMNTNPAALEGLEVFDKTKKEYFNIIVTNNSPLGPVLKHGAGLLLEKGMY